MAIPENAETIWKFLRAAGLSANATAGILGNIAQESGGNPSAGVWPSNYGLIQWTPANEYFSSPPSLSQQLQGILSYIKEYGSIANVNANASSPADAALYFSNAYERPNAAVANNAYRESVAEAVYQAAQTGNWGIGGSTVSGSTASTASTATIASTASAETDAIDLTDPLKAANTLLQDAATALNFFFQFFKPGQSFRVAAFIVSAVCGGIVVRLYMTGDSEDKMPVIFGLTGVILVSGFMAFRPWPEGSTGEPIRPAAYIQDIAVGDIPSGPPTGDDTTLIKGGLAVILATWAAGKVLQGASNAANGLGALGNLWNWIKNIFSEGAEAGEAVDLASEVTPSGVTLQVPETGASTSNIGSSGVSLALWPKARKAEIASLRRLTQRGKSAVALRQHHSVLSVQLGVRLSVCPRLDERLVALYRRVPARPVC